MISSRGFKHARIVTDRDRLSNLAATLFKDKEIHTTYYEIYLIDTRTAGVRSNVTRV